MARILVVDDAAFMRKMVSDALTKGGHEVVGEAGNGAEAMRARPSSAHTRTGMPASDGFAGAWGEAEAGPSLGPMGGGATSLPRSSSALDMRTTNALGTSWTSRAGSPQIDSAVRTACGVSG